MGFKAPKKRGPRAWGWRAWMRLEHLGSRSMAASKVQQEKWARIDSASLPCAPKLKHMPHAPHVHQPGRGVSYASAGGVAAAAGFAASSAEEFILGFEQREHAAWCV